MKRIKKTKSLPPYPPPPPPESVAGSCTRSNSKEPSIRGKGMVRNTGCVSRTHDWRQPHQILIFFVTPLNSSSQAHHFIQYPSWLCGAGWKSHMSNCIAAALCWYLCACRLSPNIRASVCVLVKRSRCGPCSVLNAQKITITGECLVNVIVIISMRQDLRVVR